jgi:hypothetical protein
VDVNVTRTAPPDDRASTIGWVLGLVVITIVFVIGAGLWFAFHP